MLVYGSPELPGSDLDMTISDLDAFQGPKIDSDTFVDICTPGQGLPTSGSNGELHVADKWLDGANKRGDFFLRPWEKYASRRQVAFKP